MGLTSALKLTFFPHATHTAMINSQKRTLQTYAMIKAEGSQMQGIGKLIWDERAQGCAAGTTEKSI